MRTSAVCAVLLFVLGMAGELCDGQSPSPKVNPLTGNPLSVTPSAAEQQDQPLSGGTSLSIIPALAPAPLVSNESSILHSLEPQNLGVAPSVGAPAPSASGRRLLGYQ
ncbi:g8768 [Coccomyxa viridis]|uniref:G8768 protein n=1 Tax=Coccomyxa viridis TaxID=1274662 RepID=A0ABP1G180_9CHLO